MALQSLSPRKALREGAWVAGVALVLAFLLPLILPPFRINLLGRFLSLAIAALGIDLIWGYTGLLSLGHGIFFALGGYAIAMYLQLQPEGTLPDFFTLYGVKSLPLFWEPFRSLPLTLILMVVVPGIMAGLLGYLVFRNRIRGVYFSIITQAALVVFYNLFNGQQELINGTNGLKTSTSLLFGQQVGSAPMQYAFYLLTILVLVGGYYLGRGLTRGRFGNLLIAVRDDEVRLRFAGYDPTAYKTVVFIVSGVLAGISGALYTVQSGIVTPQYMSIAFSIQMVIWVAVGGRGTLIGPILGAVLVNYAGSLLSEQFPEIWTFFQGGLFLAVVTVLPDGIVGWLRQGGWDWIRARLGLQPKLATYPGVAFDESVQLEKRLLDKE